MKKIQYRVLYCAYGSNLNLEQMQHRCPDAHVFAHGRIPGYRLMFRGVASIEPTATPTVGVPVLLWSISERDERALDVYEGYPRLYRKEFIDVEIENGDTVPAMVYVMNNVRGEGRPSAHYYEVIKQGYHDAGFDARYLARAAIRSANRESTQRIANS